MSAPPAADKIVLSDKFAAVTEFWSPRTIAQLNGQKVLVAKLHGEFEWHQHDEEDEMFWVVSGQLSIHFRDRVVNLGPGELLVIPRGTEHKPTCEEPVEVVLFEPLSTVNTGGQRSDRTKLDPDWV